MMRNPKIFLEPKSDKMFSQNVENAKSLFTYIFITIARLPIVPETIIDDIEYLLSSMKQKSRKYIWQTVAWRMSETQKSRTLLRNTFRRDSPF